MCMSPKISVNFKMNFYLEINQDIIHRKAFILKHYQTASNKDTYVNKAGEGDGLEDHGDKFYKGKGLKFLTNTEGFTGGPRIF